MFGPTALEAVCRYEEEGRRRAVYPAAERQARQEHELGQVRERTEWPHRPARWLGEHLMLLHERHLAALGERLFIGAVVQVMARR